MAQTIKSYCPQYFIDGCTNLWILKPTKSCSGLGIKLERHFNKIIKILMGQTKSKQSYIVQKYIGKINYFFYIFEYLINIFFFIENPLQIFSVKVDLRQYFLVTNTQPKKLWIYK